jgi:hypothetical protein
MTEEKTSQATNEQQTYSSEIINKIYTMAALLDALLDPYNAAAKWGVDMYSEIAGFSPEKAERQKRYYSEELPKVTFRYKEAMQIIDGLGLKNKDIAQIIVLYYFVNDDSNPMTKKPFSADEKEDLIYLAGLVDAFYTGMRQNGQRAQKSGAAISLDLAKFLSNLAIFEVFLEYFEDEDKKPNIPAGSKLTIDFADDIPIKIPGPKGTPAAETDPKTIFLKAQAAEMITGTATAEAIKQPQPRQLELPFLPAITPKYWIVPNNALANDLENPNKLRINYGPYDLSVFGDKSEITSYIAISYDPDPDSGIVIKGPDRISAYERTVSNAIVSLWEAALKEGQTKPIISPEMIYRAMPGGSDKLSRGQKSAIVKAINKFRILHVEIDATDEMRKRKVIGPKEAFTLDSNYLLTTHAQYRAQNGRTVHAYRIEAEPIILTYSKAAKQLLSIPAKYLDIRQVKAGKITDKPIRMSEDRQAITDYLLRRIAIMKRDAQNKTQKQSHNILFDEVYRIAGQEDRPRDQKKELRNFCFDVLEYQTAAGNISGYKKLKEGREVAKIEILL